MEPDSYTAVVNMRATDNSCPQNTLLFNEVGHKNNQHRRSLIQKKIKEHIRRNLLLYLTMCGVIAGFLVGSMLRVVKPSQDVLMWIGLPGDMFLRLLKMMILPLLFCTVLTGTASLDLKSSGKIGLIGLGYMVFHNFLGSALGLVIGLIVKPGSQMLGQEDAIAQVPTSTNLRTQDIFADLIRNVVPDNIVLATMKQVQTQYVEVENPVIVNTSQGLINTTAVTLIKTMAYSDSTNVIGLIFFAAVMGIATSLKKDAGNPFLEFFISATNIILLVMKWFLWVSPIGITSLIAVSIAEIGHISENLRQMGMFVVAIGVGLAIQELLIFPISQIIFVRKNPFSVSEIFLGQGTSI